MVADASVARADAGAAVLAVPKVSPGAAARRKNVFSKELETLSKFDTAGGKLSRKEESIKMISPLKCACISPHVAMYRTEG